DSLQELEHEPLRLGHWSASVEDVPRHEQQVDALTLDEVGQVPEHGLQLRQSIDVLPVPPGVPIAGVDDAHAPAYTRAKGSRACMSAAASLWRVAQAGNGKRSRIEVGMSGCATIMLPGWSMVARRRATLVRKPYSARSDSAASRRPTTLSA